jgi:murein DD-endopeptidase MepM/ murein hydrolase activator NlpD
MDHPRYFRLFTGFIFTGSFLLMLLQAYHVEAQETYPRFLISPYYGYKGINSWFDHRRPNYTTDSHLLIYTGQERDDPHEVPDIPCDQDNISDNCYDGHNGYDFSLSYEPVLAAAGGAVSKARWDNNTCHNGDTCDYGLVVEIQHSINGIIYRTRYGHLTTIAVHEGQSVLAGQILGTSGSTGSSSGPHLHFDVYICVYSICTDPNNGWIAIDPFGWEPIPGADETVDPWPTLGGHESWCMWSGGEWVNTCDSSTSSHPITPPAHGTEIVIEDNTAGFSKGFGGLDNNECAGVDPSCREWWEINNMGNDGHLFRTIANGNFVTDNWAKWRPSILRKEFYEVYVFVPYMGYPNDTYTWQANYTVVDSTGAEYRSIVDEFIGEGQNYNPHDRWLSIGIYSLDADSYVYLTDATEEDPDNHCPNGGYSPYDPAHRWCRLPADAVKFVPVGSTSFLPDFTSDIAPCIDYYPLLENGDFEWGPVNWLENGQGRHIIAQYPNSLPVYPANGNWAAWLGGYNYANQSFYQTIFVPTNAYGHLIFYIKIMSQESYQEAFDFLYIRIYGESGEFVDQLGVLDNTSFENEYWNYQEYWIFPENSGRFLTLSFEATTDSTLITSFYVDLVNLSPLCGGSGLAAGQSAGLPSMLNLPNTIPAYDVGKPIIAKPTFTPNPYP